MSDRHFYEPRDGHASVPGLAHDPLNAILAPRPIGCISTIAADGMRNLAPYLVRDGAYATAAAHPIVRGGWPADYFEITSKACSRCGGRASRAVMPDSVRHPCGTPIARIP